MCSSFEDMPSGPHIPISLLTGLPWKHREATAIFAASVLSFLLSQLPCTVQTISLDNHAGFGILTLLAVVQIKIIFNIKKACYSLK